MTVYLQQNIAKVLSMRPRSCKNNQRRRLLKSCNRKVNSRYRVFFRVVLLNGEKIK